MAKPRTLIAGNWKMNGLRADGVALARGIAGKLRGGESACDLLVCPPATLIAPVAEALAGSAVAVGGQDCHAEVKGAHTGDIAAEMLADLGCRYVIVGHSERRANHGESDATVKAKAAAGLRAGLVPIVCIGETEAERDRGEAIAVVERQLAGSVPDGVAADRLVIAYEPVWAIGTGRTAKPADVAEVHAAIRRALTARVTGGEGVRILYGGSVKPDNAGELMRVDNVNGALVGGASLKVDDFWGIVERSG